MPNRLDRQRRPSKPHQRVNYRKMVRGYDVRPHTIWGESVAEVASEIAATTATAGTPGTWSPASSAVPTRADLLAGNPVRVTASPASAWTTAQRVLCSDSSNPAYWNGTAWIAGQAP